MGMFLPEDKFYDETKRQVGFNRYKQLLSRHFKDWFALNAITILGLLPLAAGIFLGMSTSSILVLLPASAVGGAIFGPFLSGLYDAFYRAFRDDPMPWRRNYAKSWKQNWRGSLLPGAVLGVLVGLFCFLLMLFWYARVAPGLGTVALCIMSAWLSLALVGVYWPQLVLFQQSAGVRLRNCLLFLLQNFGRVLLAGMLQLLFWAAYILFAPWTILLLPILGIWYPVFLMQILLYDRMDAAFEIEASHQLPGSEGSPV